jgi:hypothetical protein
MPASYNRNSIQAAGCKIYLAAAPATVVGSTTATITKELFELFLVDGDKRDTLKPGLKPWTIPTDAGFKATIDAKKMQQRLADGGLITLGYETVDYKAELNIPDVDPQHMKDLLSGLTSHLLTLVKSATQAGRETFLGGGQRSISRYAMLCRFPSSVFAGEFRHVLIPACTLAPEGDVTNTYNKPRDLKVKIDAEPFDLLPDPATGNGVLWLDDMVTDAKG